MMCVMYTTLVFEHNTIVMCYTQHIVWCVILHIVVYATHNYVLLSTQQPLCSIVHNTPLCVMRHIQRLCVMSHTSFGVIHNTSLCVMQHIHSICVGPTHISVCMWWPMQHTQPCVWCWCDTQTHMCIVWQEVFNYVYGIE